MLDKIFSYFLEKYGESKTKEEIYDETIQMVSDLSKDVSPHVTGGAVDVVLHKQNGELVDMGCPVNFIGEKAYLTTENISEKQKKNRDILTDTFLKYDFSGNDLIIKNLEKIFF